VDRSGSGEGQGETLLPCSDAADRGGLGNYRHCIGMPVRRIASAGWQAVNAPLKGGRLTTTAAIGELVNQLTRVLTNDHLRSAPGSASPLLDWHGPQSRCPSEPARVGYEVFHVFGDEPAVRLHFLDSILGNGFKINQSPLAWRR
jgi:hypothetical protein